MDYKTVLIAVMAVIVVLLAGVNAAFLMGPKDTNNTSQITFGNNSTTNLTFANDSPSNYTTTEKTTTTYTRPKKTTTTNTSNSSDEPKTEEPPTESTDDTP